MIHFLLDTDHVSLQERGHLPLLTRLREHPQDTLGVSIVTVQEIVRGQLVVLSCQLPPDQLLLAYAKLQQAVQFFSTVNVLAFDRRCQEKYEGLLVHGELHGAGGGTSDGGEPRADDDISSEEPGAG